MKRGVPLWKKFWLLFTVMWVTVAALHAGSILAFAEGELERAKAWYPVAFGVLVPAAAYLLLWAWAALRRKG